VAPSAVRFVAYSDYLCPWCYNASVRLERLRDDLAGRVEVEFRSFLLRPRPEPARDLERFREYTRSWLLGPSAEPDSASFRAWQGDEGPPSHSVPPHLVAKAAATLGPEAFARMHARLLRAYFLESRDISRPETLRALWDELALPAAAYARADDPALLEAVRAEHAEALECGASGVPAVRLATGDAVITGAQPYAFYRRWAERALDPARA
jgi:predicted DsbA family dithiol-disulfide isomerase